MMNNMIMDNMMNSSMIVIMCLLMAVGLILFIIIIGITVYVVARLLMKKSRTEDRPLMILKELYVKGEISDKEYVRKRNFLS